MTDADTQTPAGASPVATLVAGAGLIPDPEVIDAEGLGEVPGPLLTAEIVDGDGTVVATVAVHDDPDGEPEELLSALAGAATADHDGDASVQPADPVADGAELATRFAGPVTVSAFGDGTRVQAMHLVPVERRAGGTAEPEPVIPGAEAPAAGGIVGVGSLEKLINVALDVSVELGRTRVTLSEVMGYDVGTVVELDRAAGAPVDIRVNGTLLAQGEVVLIDDEYAVRITAIFDPNKGA